MSGLNYKSYIQEISEQLGMSFDKVAELKLSEVDAIFKELEEKKVEERMLDKDSLDTFKMLFPSWDYLYSALGESLVRAFAMREPDELLAWGAYPEHGIDYTTLEAKRLLVKDTSKHPYVDRNKYRSIKEYYLKDFLADAISLKYKDFVPFKPSFYRSDSKKCETWLIGFDMRPRSKEMENVIKRLNLFSSEYDENEEEMQDENEDCNYNLSFICTLTSFFSMDFERMLDDFIAYSSLYEKSRDSETFENVNNLLNSKMMEKFKNIIKQQNAANKA